MTQEQKDRNIRLAEALEGGKYRQIKGWLKKYDGYCCLGVACDLVAGELGLVGAVKYVHEGDIKNTTYGYLNQSKEVEESIAVESVSDYYGWPANSYRQLGNPDILVDKEDGEGATLFCAATHNDHGATFPQIAQGFRKLAADSPLEAS